MTVLLSERAWEGDLLRTLEERSGQNVYACYQCGKCTAGCPFSLAPQQVLRFLQLQQVEHALGHGTTWDCASCLTCASACPKGVSPARIHRTLRTLHVAAANGHGQAGNGHGSLDRYARAHAHPLRTALFANIHRLSRLGSALAPLSNWALNVPGAKLVAERVLGIHRKRSLPAFVRQTFPEWFRGHAPVGDGRRGTVLLFHDTFMDYNYPRTGVAATELLEKAGFRVELADMVCCGRPMISKGLVAQAAAQARTNVTRLYERARESVYIVGCEPSCLLTLRDEYPELVDEPELREKARVVARQAVLIESSSACSTPRESSGWISGSRTARAPRFCSTDTATRRRWPRPRGASSSCGGRAIARRWSTPAAAGWRGPSGTKRNTTRRPGRPGSVRSSRRCATGRTPGWR